MYSTLFFFIELGLPSENSRLSLGKSVRTKSTLWYEGSEYEQESLVDVCACVLANFYLKGLEMFDSEVQD